MKKVLSSIFVLGLLLCIPKSNTLQAQDVLKTAGNVYKLLSDTLGVRVLMVTFKPGDMAARHSHPDHAVYAIEGGQLEITHENGTKQVIDIPAGMSAIFPEETHSAKNIGKTEIKALVVEIHRPRK